MDNLIRRAKQGNPDAFVALMQSQMQNMYKAAKAVLRNDEDVADAISDSSVVCREKLRQLKEEAYFRTWMTRILINKCHDILRKQKHISLLEEMPEIPSGEGNYENIEWVEALASLGEKYRLVLMLYYVEGFKTGEIGEILGMPESTVRSRLARGRQQLAKEFA